MIWCFANMNKGMVTHDPQCSHWDQVSLNNIELEIDIQTG